MGVWIRRIVLVVFVGALLVSCQRAADAVAKTATVRGSEQSRESLNLLDEFAKAWNSHDLDALMSMMTEDCVYEASGGDSVDGTRYEGQEAVRAAFASVFERFPDAQWSDAQHVVSGDRGFSQWTFTGTLEDGRRVEVNGCDLFTLRDGKIAVKNSFRKNRPPFES